MNLPKIHNIRAMGYAAFALFSLLVSLYATFPAEAVGQRLAREIQKKSNGSLSVTFRDVSLYRLSGVEVEGVTLRSTSSSSGKSMEIPIDEARVRLNLLPLFLLRVSASAEIEAGEGSIDATISKRSDAVTVDLDIDDFDLLQPPVLAKLAGIPIAAKVNGTASAKLAFGNEVVGKNSTGTTVTNNTIAFLPDKSTGTMNLKMSAAKLGPGTLSVPFHGNNMDFSLPGIELGDIDMELEMKDGRVQVATYKHTATQLTTQISGSVTLRRDVQLSNLDACVQVKGDNAFLEKNPKLKTALQLAEVQFRKDSEGFLNISMAGSLTHPDLRSGLCRRGPRR